MTQLSPDDVVALAMMTRGDLIVPANKRSYDYQVTKMHNVGLHDSVKPLMFLLCRDELDVVEGVKFATTFDLPTSVRSGGHGVDGSSCRDGSFVIDLAEMHRTEYDTVTETITFEPGAMLSDLNIVLLRHGRMTPLGVAPVTGAGGLVLHGGIGWLTWKYGLSVDNIVGVRIVLADGTVRKVGIDSTGDDKELFHAVRGAASTVGVVTEITMRTYPMEMIHGGFWMMEDDEEYTNTKKLSLKARDIVESEEKNGTRTLIGGIYMANFPPHPSIPEHLHGKPCSLCLISIFGDDDKAKDMAHLFADRPIMFGKPPSSMPFNVFNQILSGMFLEFPPFVPYWKAAMLKTVPSDAHMEEFAEGWTAGKKPYMGPSLVGFEFQGGRKGAEHGALINKGNETCAKGTRDYLFAAVALMYTPPDPEFCAVARELARKLHSTFDEQAQADYVNMHCDVPENNKLLQNSFDGDLNRVTAIKKKVDPKNMFYRKLIKV